MAVSMSVAVVAVGFAVAMAAPGSAQGGDLVAQLVGELGVTEAQAAGGVRALLGAAKGNLSVDDYASLLAGAPELGSLAGMAAGATESAAGDALGEAALGGDALGEAGNVAAAAAEELSGLDEATAGAAAEAGVVADQADDVVPGVGEVTAAATGDATAAVSDAMGGVTDAAAGVTDAAGSLDLSALSGVAGLTEDFSSLGLDAGMVQRFVPVVLDYLGAGSDSAKLLTAGLGLM